MISSRTVVFDLDGTLVDTAPDLINALNFVLDREGLPPVPLHSARTMIGAGARRLIERGLELDGRATSTEDITRLTSDFIDYYAAHIADVSRPFEGLERALDDLSAGGYRFAVCTNKLEWLSKLLLDQLGLSSGFSCICGPARLAVWFGYTDVPIADLKPDRLINHMKELPAAVESLMLQRNTI